MSGRRVRAALAAALCAVAPLAGACGRDSGREKVVFSFDPRITSVDLLLGIERGYFARQGIEVELAPFNGTTETLPSLAQGRIDVAPTGVFGAPYLNVIGRGARIRLVAARAVHRAGKCGYASFVARSELLDSGRLHDFASLRGLRLDADRTSAQFLHWSRLFALGGLREADVEMIRLPTHLKLEALRSGTIDATLTTEPSVHEIVSRGVGKVWMAVGDVSPDHQNSFLLFGPRLLDERRDLGRKVMAGYLDAVRDYLREGKSERVVATVARLTRMPPDEVRELCWPDWSTDGRIDAAQLLELQRWALGLGLIDEITPIAELVDASFLDEAR